MATGSSAGSAWASGLSFAASTPNSPRKTSTQVFKSTRLLDQLREQIRYLHYSLRTEDAYVYWVKKFIHFHVVFHSDGPRIFPYFHCIVFGA